MDAFLPLFKQIDTFILDVDGVLTNSLLLVTNEGHLLRSMHIKDGYALQLAIKKGYKIIIISGGNNEGVVKRLQGLQVIDCHFGVKDKLATLTQISIEKNINLNTCLYMGDDMPDIQAMEKVLLPCCPTDACHQVKAVAKYISAIKGGDGCVRDVIEKVLTLQGNWE
jgi:3-deoxy-D-manno-octulosonate 8-phosphate phosphatase (KDO 8-P phosphatase)